MGFHGGGWWAFLSHDEEQDRPVVTRDLLLRVWGFARPYTRQVVLLFISIILTTGITLVSPLLMRSLIDDAIPNADIRLLNFLALGLIAVPVLNGVVGVWQRDLSAYVGESIIFDLRNSLYAHFQRMSLRFFTQSRTGELMSRLNNDVVGAQQAVSNTLISIFSNIVQLIGTLTIMLVLEWRLTLLGLAVVPFFYLPARRIGRVLRDMRRQSMILNAEMNATMNETLNVSGALLVKLFGREERELARFRRDSVAVRDLGVRSAVIGRWFFMLLGIIGAIGTALVYWVGGFLTIEGVFTVGTIVAFGAYLSQLYGPLMALTNSPVEFAQSMVSFERVFEVLDIPLEIAEKPDAMPLRNVRGSLTFDHVTFDYAELPSGRNRAGLSEVVRYSWGGDETMLRRGRKPRQVAVGVKDSDDQAEPVADEAEADTPVDRRIALTDIDFHIEPGQLVALVGPSGAGKTTITYLIPRLYDPTGGRVLIDGHDLRDVTLNSLADTIGMVTQETYLFYDTIRANLLYARPDATEAEMTAAARAANIHDFIASLPDGYETVVGERGYRLSGGERQRVAIARVILKDPRILVLDEATSHLDSLSEALIQEALQRVMEGRTSLVIAHRLSTILAADVILVMDHGRLVEKGTHAELLARDGLYASLYETQFRPERETL
ncbi:ABC transporter related protein [Candidatus Promineifilum breve]|uniref:ABC transporter related protein n=1 Tax=Candidatus Promineifilum breve TaxID=1806508 RepID=A0A160T1D5_9CHLR|nr:ABC transporter ATP-binding protein [Candidatus Promineifilum breve]CUS02295.2 ABC transporter related protein [Candidatus Promineifilum breve]